MLRLGSRGLGWLQWLVQSGTDVEPHKPGGFNYLWPIMIPDAKTQHPTPDEGIVPLSHLKNLGIAA